tara:strand:+ start:3618 stop:4760 length:1143 start_codon:yes stop_codon:yes gene_type:complete
MKLLFFTGSRSEWGYIKPILSECKKRNINYKISASNMLLLDSFGLAKKEILKDGFKIHDEIFMALDGYNDVTTVKSMGVLLQSFADTLAREKPTWLIVAGDRSESLVATIAAAYMNIPIAHIQAGELSGNIDGQARHAIGKFAHLHFASNSDAVKRLVSLGEEKFRIKLVGAPQLDELYNDMKKFTKTNLIENKYNININKDYFLVIYHPPQSNIEPIKKDFKNIFNFLKKLKAKKIWISPNNDAGSAIIKSEFMKNRGSDDYLFDNLPRHEYLILLKNTKCIIGNSSSGILESPSFKVPCINLGFRQHGRVQANNVINVKKIVGFNLKKALKKLDSNKFKKNLQKVINPYGSGNSSKKILDIILNTKIDMKLMFKRMTY